MYMGAYGSVSVEVLQKSIPTLQLRGGIYRRSVGTP